MYSTCWMSFLMTGQFAWWLRWWRWIQHVSKIWSSLEWLKLVHGQPRKMKPLKFHATQAWIFANIFVTFWGQFKLILIYFHLYLCILFSYFNTKPFYFTIVFSSRFAAPDGFRHIKPQPTMKDGISKVKSEIKGVMGIMQGNISKVLDRGSKLEDLQDKSGNCEAVEVHVYA